MTDRNLHGNKFWAWQGWQTIKWVTGTVILAAVLFIIYKETGEPRWTEKTLKALFAIFKF